MFCTISSNFDFSSLFHGRTIFRPTNLFKKLCIFVCSFLWTHKGLALPALKICLEAFTWNVGEAVTKVSSFSAALVVLAISTNNEELQAFVSRDLFSAIIRGLALESNAIISADLVGLCREIFVYLCDRDPAPREVSCDSTLF